MTQKRKLVAGVTLVFGLVLALLTLQNQAAASRLLDEIANHYLPMIQSSPFIPSLTPTATATRAVTLTITPTQGSGPTRTPTRTATMPVPPGVIVVDHHSVQLFDQIPEQYLEAARSLPMVFLDRSVGGNIDEGLTCLASAVNWSGSPSHCRRDYYGRNGSIWLNKTFTQADMDSGNVPSGILFDPDPVRYSRANWTYEYYQEASWEDLVAHFLRSTVPAHLASKSVLSFEFSYLAVAQGSNIADGTTGFFVDQPHHGFYPNRERWDISDVEEFQGQHPDKTFIFWTSSLARSTGGPESTLFNQQVRQYAMNNGQILFDVADILSHDPNGNQCYDHRDGVQFCSSETNCENGEPPTSDGYPDDGQNYPAICQEYTTETVGGHLGAVSGGKIRVAKAYWVLMAQIAGWQP